MENDDVRIWFHGSKGFVKVWDKDEEGNLSGKYQYKTLYVAEVTSDNETLATMNLERAYPQTSSCTIEENDEFLNITFEVTDTVKGLGAEKPTATVTWAYHFNKTASGAKFDLIVDDWPWQSNATELAYGFVVEASDGLTIESAENGLGFRNETGDSVGYIEWAPNATAEYADGHNETALVDSATDNDNHTAVVDLRFTNATAGYVRLFYDPWVGVGDYIIVLDHLIGLGFVRAALPSELRPVYDGTVGSLI